MKCFGAGLDLGELISLEKYFFNKSSDDSISLLIKMQVIYAICFVDKLHLYLCVTRRVYTEADAFGRS